MRFAPHTACLLFQLLPHVAFAEPFQNGGFELPGLPAQGTHIFVENNEIAGWVKTGPGFLGVVNGRAGAQQFDPIDGNQHLNFNGGDTPTGAVLSQTFDTKVGETYEVSFFVGRVFGSPNSGDVALTARVLDSADNVLHSQRVAPPSALGYGPVSRFGFTATSSSSTLSFEDTSTVTVAVDVALDAVSVVAAHPPLDVTPVVTNVHGEQRPNTDLVDVYYDLDAAESTSVSVRLEVSADGGSNWAVPVASVSQSVGAGVSPGKGKHILWNAGADWNGQVSKSVRFRVTASDTPPIPNGFALIPAGNFQMGDAFGEGWSSDQPVHTMFVSAFYMAKYEVPNSLWDEVMVWGSQHGYTDLPRGSVNAGINYGKGDRHPVLSITWYAITKWCNARSEMEKLTPCYTNLGAVYRSGSANPDCDWNANGYRLPTEAEWERSARGGLTGKRFPWGDTITHNNANYKSDESYTYDLSATRGFHPAYATGGAPYTSPVGSFAPNGYGLYDFGGNVHEYCWDWFDAYPSMPQTDPRGPGNGTQKVIRNGCWPGMAWHSRCGFRDCVFPGGDYSHYFGFRVARSHL